MRKAIIRDLAGKKFGKITVVNLSHTKGNAYWNCICDCGKEKKIRGAHLISGGIVSCGCHKADGAAKRFKKHGQGGNGKGRDGKKETREYRTWKLMKRRCMNKNTKEFKNYGGRGITVCDRWMSFENFYTDMGSKPIGKTIERIDNDKGYYLENCKWATRIEQANNTRKNVYYEYNGERLTLSQWARKTGIHTATLWSRIHNHGWELERALSEKICNELTHNGITLSIAEWASRVNIKRRTLSKRLESGWPIEKALTHPLRGI